MIFFVTDINRDELISLNELIELIVPKIIYEKATISITVP